MDEVEVYLNIPELEGNIKKMREELNQFREVVGNINKEADDVFTHWKGAAQTAYMEKYDKLRSIMEKDTPNAVDDMITFLENFVKDMESRDRDAASSLRG